MLLEVEKPRGRSADDTKLLVALSKALFFFERSNVPDTLPADAKWPDCREPYLRRGAALKRVLSKQGVSLAMSEAAREPAGDPAGQE